MERSHFDTDTGCYIWDGCGNQLTGYGMLNVDGKMRLVHQLGWELFHEPKAKGLCVLHECDNTRCWNELHLFIGTQLDNIEDRHQKGRDVMPDNSGEWNGMANLTETDVMDIRRLYKQGHTQKAIAETCGVTQNTISRVISGKRWSILPGAVPTDGPRKGEAHHNSKLSPDIVRQIRESDETNLALSKRFNVRASTIGKVRNGQLWSSIEGGDKKRRFITKVNEDIVRAIRASDEPGHVLALRYGINQSSLSAIRTGKAWTHVT